MAGGNGIQDTVASFLEVAVKSLLAYVPDDKIDAAADAVIDKIKAFVDGTETPIDNALVEPILEKVRSAFHIPG